MKSPPIVVTAFSNFVAGLDRKTGELCWKVRVTDAKYDGTIGVGVELVVTEDRILAVGFHGTEVVCLRYPSGEEIGRARLDLGDRGRVTMLVDGDLLLVARGNHVQAFGLDGQPRWKQTHGAEESWSESVALGVPGHVRQADVRKG